MYLPNRSIRRPDTERMTRLPPSLLQRSWQQVARWPCTPPSHGRFLHLNRSKVWPPIARRGATAHARPHALRGPAQRCSGLGPLGCASPGLPRPFWQASGVDLPGLRRARSHGTASGARAPRPWYDCSVRYSLVTRRYTPARTHLPKRDSQSFVQGTGIYRLVDFGRTGGGLSPLSRRVTMTPLDGTRYATERSRKSAPPRLLKGLPRCPWLSLGPLYASVYAP
ncbi:hypothetical protein C8Q78DRAFT_755621 [Trametes maxima]|nr:hypothetical protein C8Q78DRAFT_755621 [Trametes maxima]